MLTFQVPPGIGDFSAMYSKLCGVDREMTIIPAGDGPHRLLPFLEILPKVQHKEYGVFGSGHSLAYTLLPGTDLTTYPDGDYFLSVNEWLEQGHHIHDWIPGPTNYHYEMNISDEMKAETQKFIDELHVDTGVLIGVYCTSYSNSRHWGFWGPNHWFEFLKYVRAMLPAEWNPTFVFIGADYDLGIAEAVIKMMLDYNADHGFVYFRHAYTLGRFHIGSTIELIKKLSYFFVFPSGLGFLADVVNTPHMMWFPANLERMMGTFTDPSAGRMTTHTLFTGPQAAAKLFEGVGLAQMEYNHAKSARS